MVSLVYITFLAFCLHVLCLSIHGPYTDKNGLNEVYFSRLFVWATSMYNL